MRSSGWRSQVLYIQEDLKSIKRVHTGEYFSSVKINSISSFMR